VLRVGTDANQQLLALAVQLDGLTKLPYEYSVLRCFAMHDDKTTFSFFAEPTVYRVR